MKQQISEHGEGKDNEPDEVTEEMEWSGDSNEGRHNSNTVML